MVQFNAVLEKGSISQEVSYFRGSQCIVLGLNMITSKLSRLSVIFMIIWHALMDCYQSYFISSSILWFIYKSLIKCPTKNIYLNVMPNLYGLETLILLYFLKNIFLVNRFFILQSIMVTSALVSEKNLYHTLVHFK